MLREKSHALKANYANGLRFSNNIVEGMHFQGIEVYEVRTDGISIQNNTIVDCPKGITINRVVQDGFFGGQGDKMGIRNRRMFRYSAVENNIVSGWTPAPGNYAIRIGDGNGSAVAWDPIGGPGGVKNTIVPVRNNIVWPSSANTFEGDTWYETGYNNYSRFGEQVLNPNWLGSYEVGNGQIWFTGSPYRIDLIDGAVVRRTPGALLPQIIP